MEASTKSSSPYRASVTASAACGRVLTGADVSRVLAEEGLTGRCRSRRATGSGCGPTAFVQVPAYLAGADRHRDDAPTRRPGACRSPRTVCAGLGTSGRTALIGGPSRRDGRGWLSTRATVVFHLDRFGRALSATDEHAWPYRRMVLRRRKTIRRRPETSGWPPSRVKRRSRRAAPAVMPDHTKCARIGRPDQVSSPWKSPRPPVRRPNTGGRSGPAPGCGVWSPPETGPSRTYRVASITGPRTRTGPDADGWHHATIPLENVPHAAASLPHAAASLSHAAARCRTPPRAVARRRALSHAAARCRTPPPRCCASAPRPGRSGRPGWSPICARRSTRWPGSTPAAGRSRPGPAGRSAGTPRSPRRPLSPPPRRGRRTSAARTSVPDRGSRSRSACRRNRATR
ncbi:hypothetical protein SAMN05421541_104241 [Actinoplanes philippinensis]|uniref:Uncharacterized protein n=1 Tax=Actinoplanes philippinensis TaxID=35752 RepID=A0A1I2E7S5_9ACTN|nr:hypothetical protein SAMN05421541_104241 [Actinoplanes philippinensis]